MSLPQTLQLRKLRRRIGHNILRQRGYKNMTLEKLSRRTGISADRLDRFEMGKHRVELEHLVPIACTLDLEIFDLLK